MSTNKTTRLGLHSWEGTDYVKRVEFNENFQKIDEKVALIDVDGDVVDIAGNKLAKKSDLTTHTGNGDIHVTSAEKSNWNGAITNINNHIANKNNPHGVTKAQVGLSNVDNVKQASKAEFDNHVSNEDIHTSIIEKQAWNGAKTNIDNHMENKNNPHGVTKAQVGLSNVDNVKQASKAEFDNHAGNVDIHVTTIDKTNWNGAKTSIDNHISDNNNPHGVTKAQVGLGNVPNYAVATTTEAEAGSSDAKFMTPLKVRQAYEHTQYKVIKSGKDVNGVFTTVEYRRKSDNTLAIKSVLSGGTSPRYTTRTVTFYATNGTTVEKTLTFTLSYDSDGDLISEV